MRKLLLMMALSLPLSLLGGDPIPGIKITVNQSPNMVVRGQTDAAGTAILSGLQAGPCLITLNHKGRITVIGRSAEDTILMPGNDGSPTEPTRVVLYEAPEVKDDEAEKAVKEEKAKGECREIVVVTPMTDGRLKIQATCED